MDDEFRLDAPRDDLVRRVEFRADPSEDGLNLEGYAAVFNESAQIDSWEGTFRERMMPGAFTKTISERTPVLMFEHGKHPLVGSIPIGSITSLREDERGLHVRARLADNWLVEPVRDAIKAGAITGMSMRMRVVNDKWSKGADHMPERAVTEVAVAELGPVVFPAYLGTEVGVRSREVITALNDPEVRSELARIFATGTEISSAADEDEPDIHSPRTRSQRKAYVLLRSLPKELANG